MTTEDFQEIAPTLPTQPGIYKYIDAKGTILYVGKAKNIKNRLASYFGERKDRQLKTKALVRLAHHIEFTIVGTEQDALLLECALIKEHQPRYNVMLKDGKSYPYICIKMERFPRVFVTRRVVRDGSTYFGPYTSGHRVQALMDLVKQLFQLRTCNLNLQQDLIDKGKFKVCLEYHIKNCTGPCVSFEKEESYNEKVTQIRNILRGQFGAVKQHLKREMGALAEALEFEKAQMLKEKLSAFEDYQGKSTVVSSIISDVDVFSIATDEKMAYVNYLKVVNGAIIHTYTLELTKNMDEDEDSMLTFAMPYLRDKFLSENKEILVPFEVSFSDPSVNIVVPKIGDKRKLVELSEQNAKFYLLQKQKQEILRSQKVSSAERILGTLQSDLQMKDVPFHIECFDNSNLGGTNPVSACVVFKNAKPSKKDYRHYNVKTVEGPNDFATMEEVVYRRYKRLLSEGESLPQLVIIDGGKGQLSSAMKSLTALGIENKMTVVGIAKQLEEIFFPNDSIPLYIDKKSESLKLIQQARNEAHRFGITFHRNQRSKDFIQTELTGIEGIGEVTAEKLLTTFGSVKRIKEATAEELEAVIGKKATKQVVKHLIMKKILLSILWIFFFALNSKAQEGIIAIARYDQNEVPTLRYNDSLTEFSGGFDAFKSLFLKEFKMPTKALRDEKAPDGMVGFTVNLVGKIGNIEIIDSVSTEIDAEVVQVLSNISEFHPQVKPLKFVIQYNMYPDWFRDWVEEKEAAQKERQQAMRVDSLLKSTKFADLEKSIDQTKIYGSGGVWFGFATVNDPLGRYLKTGWILGGDLNMFKRNWFIGGNIHLGSIRPRQNFDNKDILWAKDTSVGLFSMGLVSGYKVIEEDKLAFTPFVGIGFCALSLPTTQDETPPEGATMTSFAPTLGIFVDYKYRVKAKRLWIESRMNTSTIRLRLAVSPMNFKGGLRGNVVDLGLGLGFYQRTLKL